MAPRPKPASKQPIFDVEAWQNPAPEHRPIPVLALNHAIEPADIRAFCTSILDAGFGGYVLHARTGLRTEYLTQPWFDAVHAAIELAHERQVCAWIVDEDMGPSGSAGGEVSRDSEAFRPRVLCVESVKAEDLLAVLADRSTLAIYQIRLNERYEAHDVQLIDRTNLPERGIAWRFFTATQSSSARFNNSAYIDTLNPKAVESFTSLTHQRYGHTFTAHAGKALAGVVTLDASLPQGSMPGFGDIGGMPWTPNFPQFFKKHAGYDLIESLPFLFFRGPRFEKIRYDFWRLISDRFLEGYTATVARACARARLKLAGFPITSSTIVQQVCTAGHVMPHFWHFDVPACDHTQRNIDSPLPIKQAVSVARQAGKSRVAGQLFGFAGQDLSFTEQKWIADYHLVLGVNQLMPRLGLLSFAGDRKRDCPPSFSPHQPWWSLQTHVNTYLARASWFISQGQNHAGVLLLHPLATGWAKWQPKVRQVGRGFLDFENTELAEVDQQLDRLMLALQAAHVEYDLGDETLLNQHGEVSGTTLRLGKAAYQAIIIPPSVNWSSQTLALLAKFAAKGGRVFVVGHLPTMTDGLPAKDRWDKLASYKTVNRTGSSAQLLIHYIKRIAPPAVSVTDAAGRALDDIWSRRSTVGSGSSEQQFLFLVNRSRNASHQPAISLKGNWHVTRWDCQTGQRYKLPATVQNDATSVRLPMPPAASVALVFSKAPPPDDLPEDGGPLDQAAIPAKRLRSPWQFERSHPAIIVLDFCKFRMAKGRYAKPSPVWKARNAIREFAGYGPYVGVQPWVVRKYGTDGVKPIAYSMLFEVENRLTTKASVSLVVESADQLEIKVNDQPVSSANAQRGWDQGFWEIDITEQLVKGLNAIELIATFDPYIEIEDVFLAGDFSTKRISNTSYAIMDEPLTLKDGDWVKQGFHFYSGNITYRKLTDLRIPKGGKTLLKLRNPAGTGYRVSLNGQHVGHLLWEPWILDLTPYVVRGKNEVAIEVLGHLRNTFGPLHNLKAAESPNYHWGPTSFADERNWSDAYLFTPVGLLEGAEILETGTDAIQQAPDADDPTPEPDA